MKFTRFILRVLPLLAVLALTHSCKKDEVATHINADNATTSVSNGQSIGLENAMTWFQKEQHAFLKETHEKDGEETWTSLNVQPIWEQAQEASLEEGGTNFLVVPILPPHKMEFDETKGAQLIIYEDDEGNLGSYLMTYFQDDESQANGFTGWFTLFDEQGHTNLFGQVFEGYWEKTYTLASKGTFVEVDFFGEANKCWPRCYNFGRSFWDRLGDWFEDMGNDIRRFLHNIFDNDKNTDDSNEGDPGSGYTHNPLPPTGPPNTSTGGDPTGGSTHGTNTNPRLPEFIFSGSNLNVNCNNADYEDIEQFGPHVYGGDVSQFPAFLFIDRYGNEWADYLLETALLYHNGVHNTVSTSFYAVDAGLVPNHFNTAGAAVTDVATMAIPYVTAVYARIMEDYQQSQQSCENMDYTIQDAVEDIELCVASAQGLVNELSEDLALDNETKRWLLDEATRNCDGSVAAEVRDFLDEYSAGLDGGRILRPLLEELMSGSMSDETFSSILALVKSIEDITDSNPPRAEYINQISLIQQYLRVRRTDYGAAATFLADVLPELIDVSIYSNEDVVRIYEEAYSWYSECVYRTVYEPLVSVYEAFKPIMEAVIIEYAFGLTINAAFAIISKIPPVVVQRTALVWNKIAGNSANYANTLVPRSFNLTVRGRTYYVPESGSKHIKDLVKKNQAELHPNYAGQMPLRSQLALDDFANAVDDIVRQNPTIQWEQPYFSGKWEIIFNQATFPGGNPVIFHALTL